MITNVKVKRFLEDKERKAIMHQMVDLNYNFTKLAFILGCSRCYLSEVVSGKKALTNEFAIRLQEAGIELDFNA